MTDPFRFDGQQTIFPLLDPVLFAEAAGYYEERLAHNRTLEVDDAAFWEAVNNYRLALSLSWTQVAEDSGVRQSVLSTLNCKKGTAGRQTFVALCLWMGITDFTRFLRKKS